MSPQTETTPHPTCPGCRKPLQPVRYSRDSLFNREQFDASRAGDWFCDQCPGTRGRSGYRYFWERELTGA